MSMQYELMNRVDAARLRYFRATRRVYALRRALFDAKKEEVLAEKELDDAEDRPQW
jgi:hypothetical protein